MSWLFNIFDLFLSPWIRIRIPNPDPDPEDPWIRIQFRIRNTHEHNVDSIFTSVANPIRILHNFQNFLQSLKFEFSDYFT